MAVLPTFSSLGSGPPVLLLHDADGGRLSFAPQVETLASAGYRAVAWDMPGYGHSAPTDAYTFKGLAQACSALIDALQFGPVTLVGHGMGAMVALEVALRSPAQVGRLVLCAGGPALDAQAVSDWVEPRLAALEAAQRTGAGMQEVAQRVVSQGVGPGALPEGVRLAEHALSQVYAGSYRRALEALPTFNRRADGLRQIAVPTLVMGGENDPCTPPEALLALAQILPDADHVGLGQVGHWPQLEDPERFDGALLDFLARRRTVH